MLAMDFFGSDDSNVEWQEQGEDSAAATFSLAAADLKFSLVPRYDLLAYP